MEEKEFILDKEQEISMNIAIREEDMDGKKVVIVDNEELGVSDFGDTLDEAIENFKKSVRLYLDAYPERSLICGKK